MIPTPAPNDAIDPLAPPNRRTAIASTILFNTYASKELNTQQFQRLNTARIVSNVFNSLLFGGIGTYTAYDAVQRFSNDQVGYSLLGTAVSTTFMYAASYAYKIMTADRIIGHFAKEHGLGITRTLLARTAYYHKQSLINPKVK